MREVICNIASILALLLCGSLSILPMMILGVLADRNVKR